MRTKRAIYNNIAAAMLQATILIFGLIMPRLIIKNYGSEINGLVSSTKQLISYFKYLELGLTSAIIYSLYKPVSDENFDIINPIVTRAKREYERISLFYFLGTIIISIIYPFILKEDIGFLLVLLIVFLNGVFGAMDFLTLSKYRVLLEADQKAFIINFITTITTILQNLLSIVFLLMNKSIILFLLPPILMLPVRSIILRLYISKKYPELNYKTTPTKDKLESRKDAFISGLSDSLNISLPIVIISFVVSLEMASIFSIYSMVFIGISSIISVFVAGMSASFGNLMANEKTTIVAKIKSFYESVLYIIMSILYSSAIILILPFINIYVTDVTNVNYIFPSFAILFTIWGVVYNSIIPSQTIVNASGSWKLLTKSNIIQVLILITSVFLLGLIFGVNGILIGMIISSVFKAISFAYFSNKKLLNISMKTTLVSFLRIPIIILLSSLPFLLKIIVLHPRGFLDWTIYAVLVTIWSSIVTIVVNLLLNGSEMIEIMNRYIFKNKKRGRQ